MLNHNRLCRMICFSSMVLAVVGLVAGIVLLFTLNRHTSHTLFDFLFCDVQRALQCVGSSTSRSNHLAYVVMLRLAFYFWCADLAVLGLCLRGRLPFRKKAVTSRPHVSADYAEDIARCLYLETDAVGSVSLSMDYMRIATRIRLECPESMPPDWLRRSERSLLVAKQWLADADGQLSPRLYENLQRLVRKIDFRLNLRCKIENFRGHKHSGVGWPTE